MVRNLNVLVAIVGTRKNVILVVNRTYGNVAEVLGICTISGASLISGYMAEVLGVDAIVGAANNVLVVLLAIRGTAYYVAEVLGICTISGASYDVVNVIRICAGLRITSNGTRNGTTGV